jgi:hypothetical protein
VVATVRRRILAGREGPLLLGSSLLSTHAK